MKPIDELIRHNLLNMSRVASASVCTRRNESCVWLDRDENPYNSPYNRYPDTSMSVLKASIAKVKNVRAENVFVANGRNAVIDALFRCFCVPGVDNVVTVVPTYDSYGALAELNGVECRKVLLSASFQLDVDRLVSRCDEHSKIIWLCSPNTPTGSVLNPADIAMVLDVFDGIVVVDESYVDFSSQPTWRSQLGRYPNLAVINTMDNSWGCAAIGVGILYANIDVVSVLTRVMAHFPLNSLSQKVAIDQFRDTFEAEKRVRTVVLERERMISAFRDLPICVKVNPSQSNFVLVKFADAQGVYRYLSDRGIVVADCQHLPLCDNCLRITVGSKPENNELLSALRQY